jgi:hypothetical protein
MKTEKVKTYAKHAVTVPPKYLVMLVLKSHCDCAIKTHCKGTTKMCCEDATKTVEW